MARLSSFYIFVISLPFDPDALTTPTFLYCPDNIISFLTLGVLSSICGAHYYRPRPSAPRWRRAEAAVVTPRPAPPRPGARSRERRRHSQLIAARWTFCWGIPSAPQWGSVSVSPPLSRRPRARPRSLSPARPPWELAAVPGRPPCRRTPCLREAAGPALAVGCGGRRPVRGELRCD